MRKPGDLVQVDTLDVRPFPWITLKQFTARDVVSRWDVIEARRRATATTAKEFIDTLEQRMPFKVKALQVDGGSEFYSDFEEEGVGSAGPACTWEKAITHGTPPGYPGWQNVSKILRLMECPCDLVFPLILLWACRPRYSGNMSKVKTRSPASPSCRR